jgi:predicted secreted protein
MTTAAKKGFGCTLTRDGNAIAEITNIGGVELAQATIDATNHASTSDYREYIGGLLDGGSVPIEGNFKAGDTTGQIGLKTDMEAHTLQTFVLTLPAAFGVTWTFTALVTKFAVRPPMDGIVTFASELKISGKPTLGITASNDCTDITCTTGTLLPAFAAATYDYVVTTTGATVTFTATFAAGVCTLKVNGAAAQTLTTTFASSEIDCGDAGDVNEITIEVAEANKTAKLYTLQLAKTA